jgi:hypothetical protein
MFVAPGTEPDLGYKLTRGAAAKSEQRRVGARS